MSYLPPTTFYTILAFPNRYAVQRASYRTAFPGNQLTVEDYLAEGDTVVSRWTGRGTHKGDLMGIAPTGKQVTVTGISIQRIANGKIVEEWSNYDMLGMLQQLGVVPMPGQASK